MKETKYPWTFAPLGGKVRVKLCSGEDIAHLGELDKKLWTVLSCPTTGLEFDAKTLKLLDIDADGKIRVDEVIESAQWITSVLKDRDLLLKGDTSLPLDQINTENETGARLLKSAKQILANLGLKKDRIDIADTSDSVAIFAQTKANGDGIITVASADDEELKTTIQQIIDLIGSATDRSGAPGVTAEQIEAFYAALADYTAWVAAGTKDILPYGDNTEAALAACDTVKDKVADFFMRCKLIKFNEGCAGAVDVSVDKIGAISDGNMAEKAEDIATYPLARPGKDGILPFEGINPAWQAAFANLKALVLDVEFPKKKGITEAEWNGILAKFDAFKAWKGAKAGAAVESLGADAANAILKADRKADLLALVEADLAKTEESNAIDEVDKLMHLYRDFFSFLNNYVVFADFYAPDKKAMFQAGRLYIDQRSTDLCIKVDGPSAEISSLSGMYILYCNCVNEKTGKTMNIAAVLTDGDVDGLRAGKNAVFYDRAGDDWSAKVTAIVENPISIRQAFWAPYKKVGRMINDKIDKSAAEKNEKSMAGLTSATDSATSAKLDGNGKDSAKAITSSFDIAKFAGIFAAIGMAVGFIGQFIVAVVKGIAAIKFWVLILIILGIMLLISGPSMFIAWRKLRKRDLGPVLNANGWAINSAAYVNIKFGATLTDLAKYPKLQAVDPEARKKRNRRRFLIWFIVVLLAACAALFFTDNLKCIGLPFHKEKPAVEQVEEAPAEAEAEAVEAEVPAEEAAAE